MAIEITRRDLTARELRAAPAKARDAARRMRAIALAIEGNDRKRAAETCGMDRETLRDRVHRYNAEGLAGLKNRKGLGRPCRLTAQQKAELAALAERGPDAEQDGVVRWRCADLKRWIEEMLGGMAKIEPCIRPWLFSRFGQPAIPCPRASGGGRRCQARRPLQAKRASRIALARR
jgi:transposase